jgi:hypothetical protein
MRSRLLCYALAFLFAALLAPAAFADGLPVLGVDVGSQGVSLPGGADRYVALVSGRETTVARVAVDGGRVLAFRRLTGKLTIPAVAYDGSASGLSANGSTLALIEPRTAFPRATTTFAILAARGLQVRRRISLVGDFSFDAISPDGRTMFLIQYTFPRDPTRYSVRAFDLGRGVLLRRPVVDPNEHEDAMRGSPITRVTSADGRWAYTLYDGAGKTPFVHALDTRERRARCIDLPMLVGRSDLWTLHLRLGAGTTLVVHKGRRSVAQIDRKSFRASAAAPASSSHGLSGGVVLPAGLAGLLALAGLGSVLLARRHLRTEGVAPEHAA